MPGPLSGTIGGRYAICGEIASGGMATVHLARQLGAAGFARMVAVKRLHERLSRDPEFVGMFLDEARIVGRIRHPNVVQTIDVVAEESELFIVMEYVHGESLLRLLQMANRKGKVLPPGVAASIMVGALRGLHEAHEAKSETGEPLGVVHRDVSPHNVLVGVDGIARVLDFGVAKASQRIQTTQSGHLKGKLSYMAPEQVTNQPVDRRTDVYAAAVVLWESLTGAKKFFGDSEAAVLNQILLDPPRPPSALNRAVPPELDAVVMKGLAREPSDRYADARLMAEALERAITLASASQVGEVLSDVCGASISVRQHLISVVEAKASSSNMQEAVDSLRSISQARIGNAARPSDPGMGSAPRISGSPIQTAPPQAISRLPPPAPTPVISFPPQMSGDMGGGTPEPMARGTIPSGPPPSGPPISASRAGSKNGAVIGAIAMASVLLVGVLATAGFLFVKSKRDKESAAIASASSVVTSDPSALAAAGGGSSASAAAPSAAVVASCPAGMAFVPGGRFFMGSDDELPAEKPAHKVALKGFCMDKLEVSTDAYRACSDRGDCKRAATTNRWEGITAHESKVYDPLCNIGDAARGTHPINCVEWMMADRFCKAEGKRLPTEAEWEYAARGSDGRKFPWGDAMPTAKHLNACGNECVLWGKKHGEKLDAMFAESDPFAATAPVGSFPAGASRWGIEDIVGNVWEWVADFYGSYTEADVEDPMGPASGATRVMRGGAWNGGYPDWVRPSFRFHAPPDTRSHGVGFRCAKSL